MGKKHRHEKHHKHRLDHERESVDSSDDCPVLVPKLIVKFGSENTPERQQYSPDFAVKEENKLLMNVRFLALKCRNNF